MFTAAIAATQIPSPGSMYQLIAALAGLQLSAIRSLLLQLAPSPQGMSVCYWRVQQGHRILLLPAMAYELPRAFALRRLRR